MSKAVCDYCCLPNLFQCATREENEIKHEHGPWNFRMDAFVKPCFGTGTGCAMEPVENRRTSDWQDVVAFVEKHRNQGYCKVVAQRNLTRHLANGTRIYSCHHYWTVFHRCAGCQVLHYGEPRKPPSDDECIVGDSHRLIRPNV